MINTILRYASAWSALILVVASASFVSAQNTLQGQARIVPEAEVERQSLFVEAEKERLIGKYDKAIELYKKFLYDNGNNDAAWFGLSRTYFAVKDEANALDAVGKAIGIAPNNQWYRIFQADIFEKTGRNKDALGGYAELSKLFPEVPEFLERLAYLQVLTDDPKSALKTLEQLEKLQGIREKTSYEKHLIFVGLKDYKKAAGVLEKLIATYPAQTVYRHRLAQFYESTGDQAAAQKVYEGILEIDPNDPVARLAAVGKPKSGKDVEFLGALEPLFADPNVSIDAKIKDLAPYFEKLRTGADPALTEAMLRLGAGVEKAHPKDPKAWALSGDLYYLADRPTEALERYRQCIALNATVFSVWENLLRILHETGQLEELYKMANKAIDDFPNQPPAYYYFGLAANTQGKPQEALPVLEQAVLMTVNAPGLRLDILSEVAESLILQKQYQKAATRLESVLMQGGDRHPGILEHYGDAQSKLGNQEKAREYWKKAMTIKPSPQLEKKMNDLGN